MPSGQQVYDLRQPMWAGFRFSLRSNQLRNYCICATALASHHAVLGNPPLMRYFCKLSRYWILWLI